MAGGLEILVVALLVVLIGAVAAVGVALRRLRGGAAGGPGSEPIAPVPSSYDVVPGPVVATSTRESAHAAGRGVSASSDADRSEVPEQPRVDPLAGAERERADLLQATRAQVQAERVAILQAAHDEAQQVAQSQRRTAGEEAQRERAELLQQTRQDAEREREQQLASARVQAADLVRRDERLSEREARVDADERQLRERAVELRDRDTELRERDTGLRRRDTDLSAAEQAALARQAELDQAEQTRLAELERVAGLTAEAAKAELLGALQTQLRRESALTIRDMESTARTEGERTARWIIAESIQRVASEQTAESVVSVLHLPSDEMKGRIIGREGRNIRTFESVTGVNVIIDDTPEAVLLSCFDPVRREVGRLTLEALVADGRIHPHRIEEVYERSRTEVDALCRRAAEDAILEVGIDEVHPDLIGYLGRLRYRTSYGQNVLKHLVECAHIAGLMAAELRMDGRLLTRATFLHDIGKALTHEVQGTHALVGADLARRYGEHDEVVHAIEAHHNEVAPQTVEAVLVQACDACSGGRPGARRESLEVYVARLERIEEIASQRPGVEKVFAMQAGREIRVMVAPDQVDDVGAHLLAREVAQQIEDELTYPGQIRVTVVRETRVSETAH